MKHCMLDLETMGTGPDAAIVAIGAVMFEPADGLGERFYCAVDLATSVATGGVMDVSTVRWWLKQSDAARQEIAREDGLAIYTALHDFAVWLSGEAGNDAIVWGNGADFDNVILANVYRRCEILQPWYFRNNRCFRTLRALSPDVAWDRMGTAHNALDDAVSQAQQAVKLLRLRHGGDLA